MSSSTKKQQAANQISLVWLRRDLRLHDHAAFAQALEGEGQILPIFVFDTDILKRFSDRKDRRLTFIMQALWKMHARLSEKNFGVLVLYGRAEEIVPQVSRAFGVNTVVTAEDFEPETMKRDAAVKSALENLGVNYTSVLDHLIFSPKDVLKADNTPYLVFTSYSKAWRRNLQSHSFAEKRVHFDKERLCRLLSSRAQAILSLMRRCASSMKGDGCITERG